MEVIKTKDFSKGLDKRSEKLEYTEILLLTVISFSPLISQVIKGFLVLLLVLINYRYLLIFKKKKGSLLLLFLILFLLGIALDIRNVSSLKQLNILNFYFPLCFILGYIISEKYNLKSFLYLFDKIMFIISLFSLVGVFLYTFVPHLISYLPSYDYYGTTQKTALIFNILIRDDQVLTRNSGIAWEPGAFQFLINLGFYGYLRTSKRTSFIKIIVYILALITTRSTAGFIIFPFITFELMKKDKTMRLFILTSVVIFGAFILEEITYQFNSKLLGSESFDIRLLPLLTSFEIGKSYIGGLGNTGFELYYRNNITPPWDSIGQIFIRYGYPLFILIFVRLLQLLKEWKILFLILFITFLSQNIWFFPLITPFYFYEKSA